MSAKRLSMLICGLCISAAALAGDEDAVDVAFLEYLGEWEEADDDWLLFGGGEMAASSEPDEPAEEEADPPEKEDES
jgi:hypothetical protein